MQNTRVYTMAEVQAMLGISKSNTYNFARLNMFPVVRLGRRYLAPREAFDAWLNSVGKLSK